MARKVVYRDGISGFFKNPDPTFTNVVKPDPDVDTFRGRVIFYFDPDPTRPRQKPDPDLPQSCQNASMALNFDSLYLIMCCGCVLES